MLTDDEIKAIIEDCDKDSWLFDVLTRLLSAEAKVKVLEEALRAIPEELDDQNYHDVYAIVHTALQQQSK